MSKDYPSFIFIRHAESQKNLRDITGGIGEPLTKKGLIEAINFSKKLITKLDLSKKYTVVSSNTPQSIDTGKQISDRLDLELIVSDIVSPAGLGVAGGLSPIQIEEQYPEISKRLKAWRQQEIEAIDLQIPEMESPKEFWTRIIDYLISFKSDTNNIIVCTRSTMVLIANLATGKRPYKGGGYKHIGIKHCDTIAFKITSRRNKFITNGDIHIKLIPCLTTVDFEDTTNA